MSGSTFRGRRLASLSLLLGLGALVLALVRAARRGFWYDEAYTARLAELTLPRAVRGALQDIHPPLWVLIEWPAAHLPISPELALRLPSALAFAGVAAILGARSPLLGLAVLFHLPLLDLAAQARPYAALALGLLALTAFLERRSYPVAGLVAGMTAALHGAAPALVAALALPLLPWKTRPRSVAAFLALSLLPQVWWIGPWLAQADTYVRDPWYAASTPGEWLTPFDGAVGLIFLLAAFAIATPRSARAAWPAVAVAGVFAAAEMAGTSMELRKLGVVLTGLLLWALPTSSPRAKAAAGIILAGFALSSRTIHDRPDLREAANKLDPLPDNVPIVGHFASELRYYVRHPGPIWASRDPFEAAQRLQDIASTSPTGCVAAAFIWGEAPSEARLTPLRTIAWTPVTGMAVRLYGTDRCRLVPQGWTAGDPCAQGLPACAAARASDEHPPPG